MALNDKNLIITPNIGSTSEPKIDFVGASTNTGPSTITATIYSTNNGTISFDGTEGSLFSIANNLSTGSIFSVNPISGIPIIDVNADRTISLNPFGGNTGIGTTNPTSKLHVVGDARFTGVVTASNGTLISGIGIATAGGTVGIGATLLDFRGSGISTVTVSSGIATINISGGGTIAITDNTSTNATYYVGIANTTTGSLSALNVSSTKLTFNPSTGNMVVGGTVTANSDESLKTNIKTIDNALEKVLNLRGVEYDRLDTLDHQIGLIAQEVEKIVPEVVYPKQPTPDYETKSVAYANLIGLLIEAIKEQNQRIVELEIKLEEK
jgi:hypothetical protein